MEELVEELEELTNEYIKTIEKYPLLQSTKEEIMKDRIQEIQKYFETEDEFYLKKAKEQLKDVIEYVKETSKKTKKFLMK